MKLVKTIKQLWHDERGVISSAGMILITLLVAIGSIVGLVAIRDHVTQQLGDAAVALDNLDQSFSYEIEIDSDMDSIVDITLTCEYVDSAATLTDGAGAPACLTFDGVPSPIESTLPTPTALFP
jgi:hypothetical protein